MTPEDGKGPESRLYAKFTKLVLDGFVDGGPLMAVAGTLPESPLKERSSVMPIFCCDARAQKSELHDFGIVPFCSH